MTKIVIVREFANHTGYMTEGNAWSLSPDRARGFNTWEDATAHLNDWKRVDPHHVTHSRVVVDVS